MKPDKMKTALLNILALALCTSANAATLTGIGVMGSTEAGNWTQDSRWNTIGGDTIVSLYVVGGGFTDPFLNGPNDAQAAISIPLGFGTHTFSVFLTGGVPHSHHAMNLFFNGQNVNPGISVFAPTQLSATPPFPPHFVNMGLNSQALAGQTVPASGSLVFQDATSIITLTAFRVAAPEVHNLDRIGHIPFGFSFVGADGVPDRIGQFTIDVVPVPEPATWTLLGLGVAAVLARTGRRR